MNIVKKSLGIWAAVAVLAACNNRTDSAKETTDELPTEEVVGGEELTGNRVVQTFPQLFGYMDAQDTAFTEQAFAMSGESKWDPLPATPLDSLSLQPFAQYFVYNSDSTKAADLHSYNYIITERKGVQKMEEAGPDTEVGLIDVKSKTRKRLLFSGPSTTVYEAKWMNNNELMVAGAEVLQNNSIKPTVWVFNVSDSTVQIFAHEGEVKADMKPYLSKKVQ